MKNNNGGYTLVELIIVIAIMAILATTAILSVSTLSSAAARQSSNEISALLSECRVNAMSRAGSYYLKLTQGENGKISGEYFREGETQPLKVSTLSDRAVDAAWSFTGAAAADLKDAPLYIAFDRTTGGVSNFSDSADGSVANTAQCQIQVSGGSRTYTVTADALTGACSVQG